MSEDTVPRVAGWLGTALVMGALVGAGFFGGQAIGRQFASTPQPAASAPPSDATLPVQFTPVEAIPRAFPAETNPVPASRVDVILYTHFWAHLYQPNPPEKAWQ